MMLDMIQNLLLGFIISFGGLYDFFENVPDWLNDISLGIMLFLLPLYTILLVLYYSRFETFKQKTLVVKVLLIVFGVVSFLPTIISAIADFTWTLIGALCVVPFIVFICYPAVFSVLIPIPVIIAAKADKKRIAPMWWVVYAAFVGISTVVMIVFQVFFKK